MKRKGLFVGMLGMLLVFGMSFIGCASRPVVTQALYRTLGQETFSKCRFYISKDVVFTKVDTKTSVNKSATLVKTEIQRNIINIQSSTTGRVQGEPTLENLEIGFEKLKDGTIPTLVFIQKSGDGRYYFEQDSNGYVRYGNESYTVSYKGKDEPYLLYDDDTKERIKKRTVSGLR
jgi:hypothetical protein